MRSVYREIECPKCRGDAAKLPAGLQFIDDVKWVLFGRREDGKALRSRRLPMAVGSDGELYKPEAYGMRKPTRWRLVPLASSSSPGEEWTITCQGPGGHPIPVSRSGLDREAQLARRLRPKG